MLNYTNVNLLFYETNLGTQRFPLSYLAHMTLLARVELLGLMAGFVLVSGLFVRQVWRGKDHLPAVEMAMYLERSGQDLCAATGVMRAPHWFDVVESEWLKLTTV